MYRENSEVKGGRGEAKGRRRGHIIKRHGMLFCVDCVWAIR